MRRGQGTELDLTVVVTILSTVPLGVTAFGGLSESTASGCVQAKERKWRCKRRTSASGAPGPRTRGTQRCLLPLWFVACFSLGKRLIPRRRQKPGTCRPLPSGGGWPLRQCHSIARLPTAGRDVCPGDPSPRPRLRTSTWLPCAGSASVAPLRNYTCAGGLTRQAGGISAGEFQERKP